ncbi:MAG TPA: M3 family metallopeptidase [Longimicrobiales bacterium]
MRRLSTLLMALGLAAAGCAHAGPRAGQPANTPGAAVSDNPFFHKSPLQYEAPQFDRIKDSDYQPALEEGMKRELADVEAIANQTAQPTFDNTIVPLEKSGELLDRVGSVFGAVTQANNNDELQRIQTEEAPRLAAHSDAIHLNAKLFARIESLWQRREQLGLTPEQKIVVENYYRNYVRAGARLSEADKARLRELNQEESKLTTEFRRRLLAATKAGAVVLDDVKQVDGLSEGEIASAAEAAKTRGLAGKWVLPLQNTTQHPAQAALRDRAVRQRLFEASTQRAERGDANDTRAIVARIAQLRAARAKLMGFATYADFALDDRMAKTPAAAIKLLTDVAGPATARARGEAAKMQALIDKQNPAQSFKLAPWDWQYYSEQVRKAEYDLDEGQIKPYFEMKRVLEDGVFFAANQLYGLTFKERKDLPVYHPDVRVFEVFDADGKSLALFYCDYFKRDNKGGGAWSTSFVGQSKLLGTHPVVNNVANFQKPAAGQPALMTYDEVTTMFHEFGHALHSMFSTVVYPSAGRVPRDFVELPSQFNEHWALEPTVFAHFARHYQTGAPMPQALVDKIRKADTFNQGFATTEYLAASLLDMAWYTRPADAPAADVDAFEAEALHRYGVDLPEVPPRYRSSYFSHIWGSGYAAGYYAYMWAEVLDQDAYAWFTENGGLTRANGQRFRDMILSRGGTIEAGAMFRAFRGRDPSIVPLLKARGLTAAVSLND